MSFDATIVCDYCNGRCVGEVWGSYGGHPIRFCTRKEHRQKAIDVTKEGPINQYGLEIVEK